MLGRWILHNTSLSPLVSSLMWHEDLWRDRICPNSWCAAWAIHPDLILIEVGCVILELEVPFVEREPPLFI
jgi:hypothetical protein